MIHKFKLPNTPKCKVLFVRDETLYKVVLPTPPTNDALQVSMLGYGVGWSQIRSVQSFQPHVKTS